MEKELSQSNKASTPYQPSVMEAQLSAVGNGWTPQKATELQETSIKGTDLVTIITTQIPEFRYLIIDCRFPYEYNGGHVLHAVNLYTLDDLLNFLHKTKSIDPRKLILIFYCEFSTVRAPRLMKDFRNVDRLSNPDHQPTYPYCFLLENGFSRFYEDFSRVHTFFSKDAQYISMHDSRFTSECCYYHSVLTELKQMYTGINYDLAQPRAIRPFGEAAEEEERTSLPPAPQPSHSPLLGASHGPLDTPENSSTLPGVPLDAEQGPAPSLSPSFSRPSSSSARRNRSLLGHAERNSWSASTTGTGLPRVSLSVSTSTSSSSTHSSSTIEAPQLLSDSFASSNDPYLRSSTTSFASYLSDNSLSTPPPSPGLPEIDPSLSEQVASMESLLSQAFPPLDPSLP